MKWIGIFFTDFHLVTQNYGYLSELFLKGRGVNQGCPVSPFCYLVMGELIAQKIKKNQKIKGINLGKNIQNILAQFADDTALFVKFEKISIEEVVSTFQNIEANTGLKISYDKTVIYRVGSIRNSDARIYTQTELLWSNDAFDMLGVTISGNEENTQINFDKTFNRMSEICEHWSSRTLTLMGEVLVINVLMESLFVYKLNALNNISEEYCVKD